MTPQSDVALALLTSMGVGGAARWFVSAAAESDVIDALRWAHERHVDVFVLGGGSNVVIADGGVRGLVLHVNIRGVDRIAAAQRCEYRVGAGEAWDPFVAMTVAHGLAGLECLSGIPGFAGGTPVQNVGAYGQDVSTTITRVHVVERATATTRAFTNQECAFGYRTSRFKHADADRYVVTAIEYALVRDAQPTITYADVIAFFNAAGVTRPALQDVRSAVIAIRRRKGMVIEPGNAANQSCGSFFVNPVVGTDSLARVQAVVGSAAPHYVVDAARVKIPAAWLIERAGFLKGSSRGRVGISPFQAQAIVNHGGATAADVLALAADVKRSVWNMFGISLTPEPVFVGFEPTADYRYLLSHTGAD